MILDFNKPEAQVVPHFKGGAGEAQVRTAVQDGMGRILSLTLPAGSSIGLHTHEGNSEIIYILEGAGKVEYAGGVETLAPGDCHYCTEHHTHRLINDSSEDLNFFAVVPQHHL